MPSFPYRYDEMRDPHLQEHTRELSGLSDYLRHTHYEVGRVYLNTHTRTHTDTCLLTRIHAQTHTYILTYPQTTLRLLCRENDKYNVRSGFTASATGVATKKKAKAAKKKGGSGSGMGVDTESKADADSSGDDGVPPVIPGSPRLSVVDEVSHGHDDGYDGGGGGGGGFVRPPSPIVKKDN